MQEPASQNAQPIPAHVFQIMLSLLDGDSHGYTVIEDVAARTGGSMRLGTSTLYAVIKRLERTGWAESVAAPAGSQDGRRKYHRLTDAGREAVRREAERIRETNRMLRESGLDAALGLESESRS